MEYGNYILNPLFVCRFMVKVEFRPGKERLSQAFGVIFLHHGKARLNIVGTAYGPVGLLALVKDVQCGIGLVNPVAVNQKKGRIDGVRLLYHGTAGIGEEFSLNNTIVAAGIPIILYPCPGFIVNIDKILIIKVNFGKISFSHTYSFAYSYQITPHLTKSQIFLSQKSKHGKKDSWGLLNTKYFHDTSIILSIYY